MPAQSNSLLLSDPDTQETREWLDALKAVIEHEGPERAHYLIERLVDLARRSGINLPYRATTAYVNTIAPGQQTPSPGNHELEHRIRSYVRWNAAAMVVRANREDSSLGGHIATFASAATLYDVGYNHFWHAPSESHGGDLVLFQGHANPGIYARAFMHGLLTKEQMNNFRREVDGKGIPSYPHPWLMPAFWQFPTVSMGLGPLQAIYHARFMKYLNDRGIIDAGNRKVWAFMGDGEMDQPESMGAISLGGRERLDNLIFVINCNLQRLDGPVRGNGKIIQELEAYFRGAGWNVIKVIWGSYWDPLLAQDRKGLLRKRMEECVDGDYQNFKSKDGAYVREHFFNSPELKAMVATWSDDEVWRLNRGGHDPHKVYAAYHAAVNHSGQPTVILTKTIKGYGMGEAGEAQNITHQQKKMGTTSLISFRDRFGLPLTDEQAENVDYLELDPASPEYRYMVERRQALGGFLPQRRQKATPLEVPALAAFETQLKASAEGREFSTTMAFVRMLGTLVKDKVLGRHIVPIVADEARTFGMEGMFRSLGIWSSVGQQYTPEDAGGLAFYKESKTGQILQEGLTEAGAMASWIAAATSYSTHGVQMIPFFIYYSMFGFQRFGDLAWAAGDQRARGFLLGGTSGRTTLNGEGLQHEDGHSHVQAALIPNCIPYDPTFSYEVAVILHDGLRRMVQEQEDVFYYITLLNENYAHPALPEGSEQSILKGMYLLQKGAASKKGPRVQLLGSGAILREVIAAAQLLKQDWGVDADIWSCPSFTLLARDGQDVTRWNLLHPDAAPRLSHVEQCLNDTRGPVIASTDYVRAFAEQIRPWVARNYSVLGTDGFGRSDTREKLREFFEVDRHYVTLAALTALADEGAFDKAKLKQVIAKYRMDSGKPNPTTV